jgi:hypothetical protein
MFLERLASITKSTYLFVQQLITLKLLDLDNDEYEKIPHRYRTRVDADAAALELLCLSCDDEIGKHFHSPSAKNNPHLLESTYILLMATLRSSESN